MDSHSAGHTLKTMKPTNKTILFESWWTLPYGRISSPRVLTNLLASHAWTFGGWHGGQVIIIVSLFDSGSKEPRYNHVNFQVKAF